MQGPATDTANVTARKLQPVLLNEVFPWEGEPDVDGITCPGAADWDRNGRADIIDAGGWLLLHFCGGPS